MVRPEQRMPTPRERRRDSRLLGAGLLRLLAAAASGLVLWLVSPPVGLHWLHWFSFVPLFWALRPNEHRRNAKLGYMAGWLATFVLFFWLIDTVILFSNLPLFVAIPILMLFSTVFSVHYALTFGLVHWLRQRIGLAWVVLLPCVHVSLEVLSPALFPYFQGVSQYRTPWTWQLASVTGVVGVTWLVLLTNCVLAETVYRWREGRRPPVRALVATAVLFAGNLAFGAWRVGHVEAELAQAPTMRAALLQQGVTMEQRMSEAPTKGVDEWARLTRQILDEDADLVVWPEGSFPYNPDADRARQFLGDFATKGDFDFLVGGGTVELHDDHTSEKPSFTAYNSCYLLDRKGAIADRYDKMVPLPFGEYIPFGDTFPWLKEIIKGPGDFQAGTEPTLFEAQRDTAEGAASYTFTVPICYEAILADQMWLMKDADLFVNITNDGWFGDTTSPHQHAMLAAVQSMHLGRPMLRIAYTGINMVVEPHGRILYETEPFTESVQVQEVRLGKVDTLYRAGGRHFGWLCVAFALGGVAFARTRSPKPAPAAS